MLTELEYFDKRYNDAMKKLSIIETETAIAEHQYMAAKNGIITNKMSAMYWNWKMMQSRENKPTSADAAQEKQP
jgi:hypothetical protein